MGKLIVTADVHGSFSTWLTIKRLLKPDDKIAIAGDLFDTKYGNTSHVDFQPESIRKELKQFKHPYYYVYGNCDTPSFFPGFESAMTFKVFNKKIFLHHGHQPHKIKGDIDIIIQGHTHLCHLEKKGSHIFMNPGSITFPRNDCFTYGIIDQTSASLMDLKTGEKLTSITC